ncbi:28S ribosomal protein S17, mitochondrial-like [Anneissia japonica]|uniref:28S ribosomal protein S17, mitochondrial-like n=1 Tax=Anneissia japonica TaxID=1529436 RepID=UPI00142587D7|nr:28S ribosomal protein S17, mitochondrial-like [Anneissia japonica]
MASRKVRIFIGQVIGTKMKKTAKVAVQRLVLDNYILQYFPEKMTAFAHDPHEEANEGDIVLIEELPVKRSKFVKYRLDKVIHRLGNVVDPFSGRKCDSYSYWNDKPGHENSLHDAVEYEPGHQNSSHHAVESKQEVSDGTPV